ncbi:MAG TPA: PQQ-binding-like beta-propeller repeat protein [Candidatus Binataceae bacterium]
MLTVIAAMALSACTNAVGCQGCNPPPAQWLSYRNNPGRYGQQFLGSALSNPTTVLSSLHVGWRSPDPTWTGLKPGPFRAAPVVFNGTIFIGDVNGVFWAINAQDGTFRWRYPPTGALNGSCTQGGNGSWGNYGIQSSASYASIGTEDAVIVGAPDPDLGTDGGNGSARLWALDAATGNLIWKSKVVAHVNGCPGTLHERIAYSSPLVFSGRVFVGVHDAGDDPVQKGKIVAVDLNSGDLASGFPFVVDGAPGDPSCGGVCGGGVWDSPATDGKSILFTTGNVCDANYYNTPECETQPSPDYSLSLVSIDPTTGSRNWNFRAVPYKLDADPDWAAGPTSMLTSCGQLVASVEKDGWTYAVNPADGSCKWQFPPTAGPGCTFSSSDTHSHGDDNYKQPGASWGDYLFIQTGGDALTTDGVSAGYGRLHALDACNGGGGEVRWIADILPGQSYSIGAPVVTGGIVYVTTSTGHVVALADPSVAAPVGFRCTSIDFGPPSTTWVSDCLSAGYSIVPVPASRDVALDDNGNAVGLRMEAAIALDKLYVATNQGHVYALWP